MASKKAKLDDNLRKRAAASSAVSFSTTTLKPFSHIWNINNFSCATTRSPTSLKSAEFTDGTVGCKWQLEGTFNNWGMDLVLRFIGASRSDSKFGYQFRLLDAQNKPIWEGEKMRFFHVPSGKSTVVALRYTTLKMLDKNCHPKLEGDLLRVHCQMWNTDENTNHGQSSEVAEKDANMELLRNDYEKLFLNPVYHDVVVKTSDSEFMAHRAILSARSPVFSAIFKSKMAEAENGVIEIQNFKGDIVHEMLRYIYCGRVEDLNQGNVLDLMVIAVKYGIKGLEEMCGRKILSFLCAENAIEILVSVDLYELPDLKSRLMEYIMQNFAAVKKTKAFENFADVNPALFAELKKLFGPF